jgi:hypothetical protein
MNTTAYTSLDQPRTESNRLLLVKFGKRLDTSLADELDPSDSEGVLTTFGAADVRSDDGAAFFSLPFETLAPACRERWARGAAEPPTSLSPFTASLDFDLLLT